MTKMRTGSSARPTGRAPARRKAGIMARCGSLALRCIALVSRRPVGVLGGIAVLVGVTAIVWNTTHQSGRHPAPLFAAATPTSPTLQAVPLPVPLPVPRPDPVQLAASPAATPGAPAPEPARSAGADPIGALIRADAGARLPAEVRAGDPVKLASAQKALVKLGYGPLKTDGLFGATTRQAIERFERDRNLPVTGAVAGRTARQLAALSGYQVE